MARSASHRRDSSDARVIMVPERAGGEKSTRSSKSRAKIDDKKISIAGRMWDSFESESSSEDEEDKGQEDGESNQRGNSHKPASSARGSRRETEDREHSAPKGKPVVVRAAGARAERTASSVEEEEVETRSSRSSARRPKVKFTEGDRVSVYLPSGGKTHGIISRKSSRGRFDVTLTNGDVEKRVEPGDMSLSSRQHRRNRTSEHSIRSHRSSHSHRESEHCVSDDRRSESQTGSDSPSRRPSSPPAAVARSSSSAESRGKQQGDSIPVSPSSKASGASDSGGGDPARLPPDTATLSPDTAPVVEVVVPVASESEPDTGDAALKRASSSERSLSPLTSKVCHAQGLLKTMFWKRGDARSSRTDAARGLGGQNTRAGGADSTSRRDPTDSDHGDGTSSGPASDNGGKEDEQVYSNPTVGGKGGEGLTEAGDRTRADNTAMAPVAAAENGAAADGFVRRLSRGLSRGRSRSRKGEALSGASQSPASRSPSLATKLGMSLRGAIMGKTLLGVHKPHVEGRSTTRSPKSGSDGDDAGSEGTYSTGASTAGDRRRARRRTRRQSAQRAHGLVGASIGRKSGDGDGGISSDGFDSEVFAPDSPLAATTYGDPRNLPEAVHSYIGARERMEQEMSASGPVFLPRPANLASSPRDGATPWTRRRGSVDITKQAPSTTQLSEQHQPFTEAMFKAGVSETRHSTKQGILLEGDLQKFSPESMRGVRWHKRYCVLYAGACELRYYRSHVEAAWGRIPLGERGSIPLRLVVKIEQPSDKKYHGCRFDLVVLHKGDGRHPGLHIRPGHESRVSTTKTFKFNAADAQQRLLWVTVIEALMKKHGWGAYPDHRRSMRAPGHGGASADAAGLHWGTWGGEAEKSAAGGEVSPTNEQRFSNSKTASSEEVFTSGTGLTNDTRAPDAVMVPPTLRPPADLNKALKTAPHTKSCGRSIVRDHACHRGCLKTLPLPDRKNATVPGEPDPGPRKGSVLTFVEGNDHIVRQNDTRDMLLIEGSTGGATRRGISIPYSPRGRMGSLTTSALSPPVPTMGGARRQSSLKSDMFL